MLKPAPDPAQGFLADTQVRSYLSQWHPLYNMWKLLLQVFVPLSGCFKLGVYKPFFQLYIVFLISYPHQSFYFMKLVK